MAVKTPTRSCCLGTPAQYKRLMMKLDTAELITQHTDTQDTDPNFWFDVRDRGFELGLAKMILQAEKPFSFLASEFPGYLYLLHYFRDLQRFGCSCKEGKQGQRCEHIALLERLSNAAP